MQPAGLIAYLMTPLSADGGRVRLELVEPYIERLMASCTLQGFACLANDFAYLDDEERLAVAKATIKCVNGRLPVHVCTSAIATVHAIEFARHAEALGAEKVIVNPHSYMALDEDQVLAHYEAIARAVAIPIHVYNNPVATKIDMPVGLLRRIVDATGARSIKEAGSPVDKFQRLRAEFGDEVALHVGFHYMALGGFALGATAWDAGLVPSIARPCERLFRAAVHDRDLGEAQRIFASLAPLFEFMRRKGALACLKALAALDGLELGGVRAPVRALGEDECNELRTRLSRSIEEEIDEPG